MLFFRASRRDVLAITLVEKPSQRYIAASPSKSSQIHTFALSIHCNLRRGASLLAYLSISVLTVVEKFYSKS